MRAWRSTKIDESKTMGTMARKTTISVDRLHSSSGDVGCIGRFLHRRSTRFCHSDSKLRISPNPLHHLPNRNDYFVECVRPSSLDSNFGTRLAYPNIRNSRNRKRSLVLGNYGLYHGVRVHRFPPVLTNMEDVQKTTYEILKRNRLQK